MPRTLMLVTSKDSWVHASIAGFLADACDPETSPMPEHKFDFYPATGINDDYEFARNVALAYFYADPDRYDYVLFIDNDQVIGRQIFELYKHDAPIVVGRYLNPRYDGNQLKFFITTFKSIAEDESGFETVQPAQMDPIEVVAGPGGVMLIKAEVLRDERILLGPPDPHTKYGPQKLPVHPVFRRQLRIDGSVHIGEDVDFCLRAGKLGYKTLYVPRCHVGHWKMMDTMFIEHYATRIVNGAMKAVLRDPEVRNEVQRLCDEEDEMARTREAGGDGEAGNS